MREQYLVNVEKKDVRVAVLEEGNLVQLFIDDELIRQYRDPRPIDGGQIALWTVDNGIMVSRVRISSATGEETESPLASHPTECKCIYDVMKR